MQDAQEDAQNQQKEIFQRILQKMAPVIVKHAQENWLRHDCRYVEPLAAKPDPVVRRRSRHHQGRGRYLQHAVGRTGARADRQRPPSPPVRSLGGYPEASGSQANRAASK